MKFNYLKYKNFTSTGEQWQHIDFVSDGAFWLVQGLNGAGKSSISQALIYALYGQTPANNGKKSNDDLVNDLNGKHMLVHLNFESNGRIIDLKRGLKPSILEFTVDGISNDKAGKKELQKELEEDYIQIPYNIFTNIIALNILTIKSFIDLTPSDKRKIIDTIFGLGIFNEMLSDIKSEHSNLKKKILQDEIRIDDIKSTIDIYQAKLDIIKKNLNVENEKSLDDLNSKLDKGNVILAKLNKNIKAVNSNIEILHKKKQDVQNKLNNFLVELRSLKNQYNLYKNDKCPTCESDLNDSFHLDKKSHYETQISNIESKVQQESAIITKIDTKSSELTAKKFEHTNNVFTVKNKLTTIREKIDKLSNVSSNEEVKAISDLITSEQNRLDELVKNLDSLNESKFIYDELENILGENGIKRMAIAQILPILNSEIEKYSTKMGLEFKLSFDSEFNSKILSFGQDSNHKKLSTGQMRILDLSVIMAIIKLLKMKYPSLNLIFLDEIFASLDNIRKENVLIILNELSKEIKSNIFVIDFFELPLELFDYTILVKRTNNFTDLEISKIV